MAGACGFIASRVAGLLLEEGHEVTGIDNMAPTYDVMLKEWRRAQLVQHPCFQFAAVDITDKESVNELFERGAKPAAILNLAARAGVRPSVEDPWSYIDTNTVGTLNLLEACRRHEIPKFVLASSSSVYGNSVDVPFSEDDTTDAPLSPYAASKKAAEVLAHSYHYLHGLDITVLRYFTVYGPASRPDMSPFRFVQQISEGRTLTIYGDGTQSRDFTYVDDIARGTIAGLRDIGYEIINLGSDSPVSILDFVADLESIMGKAAQIKHAPGNPADVDATWANIEKAKMLLQWTPQTTLREGLEKMVGWYLDNRDWASRIAI